MFQWPMEAKQWFCFLSLIYMLGMWHFLKFQCKFCKNWQSKKQLGCQRLLALLVSKRGSLHWLYSVRLAAVLLVATSDLWSWSKMPAFDLFEISDWPESKKRHTVLFMLSGLTMTLCGVVGFTGLTFPGLVFQARCFVFICYIALSHDCSYTH